MENKVCQNCKCVFIKKQNVSVKSWEGVKFCSIECSHLFKRCEKKCIICSKIFVIKKSQSELLKTCSPECASKLRSENSKKIYDEKGAPIFRGNALQKMTDTKRKQSREGKLGPLYDIQNKKGDWEKEKNPRWQPIGTTKNDGHGYMLIKISDGQGAKNWIQEHVHNMEQKIGRKLNLKKECVHHINGIKNDNRIENLFLTNHEYHKRLHQSIFMSLVPELIEKDLVYFDQIDRIYKIKK